MALLKQSASAYALKYVISEDEGIKTRAEVLVDCAAGPLREFLRLAASPWTGLELLPALTVTITQSAITPGAGSARFRTVGPNDNFEAYGQGLVEIRFHHSAVR